MKKNITALIILTTIIVIPTFYYFTQKQNLAVATQQFADTGYIISIKYPKDKYKLNKGSRISKDRSDKAAWLRLVKPNNEDIYIDFRYEFRNNGDDSPIKSDIETGAPPWPPQPEELKEDFNPDKFIYLGKYLGKELYADKSPNETGYAGVVQKLSNGKITGLMPLLSSNKERVNYYDNFHISSSYGYDTPKEKQETLHKEFLQILKTLKIEEIK